VYDRSAGCVVDVALTCTYHSWLEAIVTTVYICRTELTNVCTLFGTWIAPKLIMSY
jgi:hypothetical protein